MPFLFTTCVFKYVSLYSKGKNNNLAIWYVSIMTLNEIYVFF